MARPPPVSLHISWASLEEHEFLSGAQGAGLTFGNKGLARLYGGGGVQDGFYDCSFRDLTVMAFWLARLLQSVFKDLRYILSLLIEWAGEKIGRSARSCVEIFVYNFFSFWDLAQYFFLFSSLSISTLYSKRIFASSSSFHPLFSFSKVVVLMFEQFKMGVKRIRAGLPVLCKEKENPRK